MNTLENNSRYRSSSLLMLLNKSGVKSARKLRKVAEGALELSQSQIQACEAICRLLLPYDKGADPNSR